MQRARELALRRPVANGTLDFAIAVNRAEDRFAELKSNLSGSGIEIQRKLR